MNKNSCCEQSIADEKICKSSLYYCLDLQKQVDNLTKEKDCIAQSFAGCLNGSVFNKQTDLKMKNIKLQEQVDELKELELGKCFYCENKLIKKNIALQKQVDELTKKCESYVCNANCYKYVQAQSLLSEKQILKEKLQKSLSWNMDCEKRIQILVEENKKLKEYHKKTTGIVISDFTDKPTLISMGDVEFVEKSRLDTALEGLEKIIEVQECGCSKYGTKVFDSNGEVGTCSGAEHKGYCDVCQFDIAKQTIERVK